MEQENKMVAVPPAIDMTHIAELSQQILKRKITRAVFRFDIPVEKAYYLLMANYVTRVNIRGIEYIDDGKSRMAVFNMAQALTRPNPRCGIMLCGGCGNGKTTLVYALQSMINVMKDCGKLDYLGKDFHVGMEIHDVKNLIIYSRNPKKWRTLINSDMMAIDDLGKEPSEIYDYGNVTSPIVDLLEQRYNLQKFTVITTNLAPKEIKVKYGERIADRFREMFEVIPFEFDSYRKIAERRSLGDV